MLPSSWLEVLVFQETCHAKELYPIGCSARYLQVCSIMRPVTVTLWASILIFLDHHNKFLHWNRTRKNLQIQILRSRHSWLLLIVAILSVVWFYSISTKATASARKSLSLDCLLAYESSTQSIWFRISTVHSCELLFRFQSHHRFWLFFPWKAVFYDRSDWLGCLSADGAFSNEFHSSASFVRGSNLTVGLPFLGMWRRAL